MEIKSVLPDKPLVTFAIFSYNQQRYIQEALVSALQQDYSPLEIIISDDCSSDNTWNIIEDFYNKNKDARHLVIRRNSKNIGVVDHVNKVFEIASGDLIVVAAGDDISAPRRTTSIVAKWMEAGCRTAVIHSKVALVNESTEPLGLTLNGNLINESDAELAYFIKNRRSLIIHGASAAYTRDLYQKYGPMLSGGVVEDAVLTFRGILENRILYIPEELVLYRVSSGSIMGVDKSSKYPDRWRWWVSGQAKKIENHLVDYLKYCSDREAVPDKQIVEYFNNLIRLFLYSKNMVSKSIFMKIKAALVYPGVGSLRDRISFIKNFYFK